MDVKHKILIYRELTKKIVIDSLFLIVWALIVKTIHEWLLPGINLHGLPSKIINLFALLFDLGVSAVILAIILKDLYDELAILWRGRSK